MKSNQDKEQELIEAFGSSNQEQVDELRATCDALDLAVVELNRMVNSLERRLSDANWYKDKYRRELDAYENQTAEEIANELIIKLESTQHATIGTVSILRNRQYKPTMSVTYKPTRVFYNLEGDNS